MKGFMNRCCFLSHHVRDLIDLGCFANSRDDNKDLKFEKEKNIFGKEKYFIPNVIYVVFFVIRQ